MADNPVSKLQAAVQAQQALVEAVRKAAAEQAAQRQQEKPRA